MPADFKNAPIEPTIEKDSPIIPLLLLAGAGLILLGGGIGLAYLGGVFTGKDAVIANDKRITEQSSVANPRH
jgi:hypothetical protein